MRAGGWRRIDLILAVVVPAVVLVIAGYQRRWMSDDGFINMRVVQNMLSGNGPVLNQGERAEVATSPMWVYLVAVVQFVTRVRLEYVFVVVGLVCTGLGMVAAGAGAAVANRVVEERRHLWLPAGLVVFAALTPAWDFATSGLDGSLAVAWIGASVLLLALVEARRSWRASVAAAVVFGLAPLVRPDLTVMGAVLFLALLGLEWGRGWRRLALLVGVGAVVPGIYQVFRMGYYGLAVPNTAVAKEATWWRADQGWAYLDDLMSNFGLGLPLVLAAVCGVVAVARDRTRLVPLFVPMAAGLIHGAYVVAAGGDFMSARLLLPSVFAVVAPVAVVAVPWPRPAALTAVALVPVVLIGWWAYLCQTSYGLPYKKFGPKGINDERGFYTDLTQDDNPVIVDSYRITRLWRVGRLGHRLVAEGHEVVCLGPDAECLSPAPLLAARWRSSADAAIAIGNIGVPGAGAPLNVHIIDVGGLGDPLGARVKLTKRGRPGHEKNLPFEWVVARFADPATPPSPLFDAAKAEAARRVLACPQWQEIDRSVTARLTVSRFLKNLFGAVGRAKLRVDVENPPVDCEFE
jgi:arabinofuranosyltransferase